MTRTALSLFLGAATSLLLLGCASKGSTPVIPEVPKAFGCPVTNKQVNTMEDLIGAKVEIAGSLPAVKVASIVCTIRNDALRIDVELMNKADMEHRIAYKFRWLDRDNLAAWDDEALKPVLLYAGASSNLTGLAPTSKAVDFRLFLINQDK
jgi:uncharacterized protein YcfL